jgi:hypothetical protein
MFIAPCPVLQVMQSKTVSARRNLFRYEEKIKRVNAFPAFAEPSKGFA